MKKLNLFLLTLLALACIASQAQTPTSSVKPLKHSEAKPLNTPPIGCTTNCLWYAGDLDPSNEYANALYNGYTPNYENITAQVWVPFVPTGGAVGFNAVEITSVTFNEVAYSAPTLTSMTYAFSYGLSTGDAGDNFASGTCSSTSVTATGRTLDGSLPEYAFTCTLPTPLLLSTNYLYWVNLLPDISTDTPLYLSDAIDTPELNHVGWGNVNDEAYFYSSYASFAPSDYVNSTTVNTGLNEFSVGMTGKYVLIEF